MMILPSHFGHLNKLPFAVHKSRKQHRGSDLCARRLSCALETYYQ